MSGGEPTNAVLAEMINGIRELIDVKFDQNQKDHDAVNEHLRKLNGQVATNTKFITVMKSYGAVFMFVIPLAISLFVKLT